MGHATICGKGLPQSVLMRLSKITVDRKKDRRGSDADVRDLLESLPEVGLLHPLLVLPPDDEGRHELLAGHRRLRAALELGWEEVPVRVVTLEGLRAELAGLTENLARKALPPGEELRAIARAKTIYEDLHPEARRGGNRRRPNGQDGRLKMESFAEHAARAAGRSARTIRRKARVGERAGTNILAALDAGEISFKQAEEIVALKDGEEGPDSNPSNAAADRVCAAEHAAAPRSPPEQTLIRGARRVSSTADSLLRIVTGAAPIDASSAVVCRQHLLRAQASIVEVLRALKRKFPHPHQAVDASLAPRLSRN